MIYKLIGMLVVKFGRAFVKKRYGTQLKAGGGGLLALAIGAAAYLASRNVSEG